MSFVLVFIRLIACIQIDTGRERRFTFGFVELVENLFGVCKRESLLMVLAVSCQYASGKTYSLFTFLNELVWSEYMFV